MVNKYLSYDHGNYNNLFLWYYLRVKYESEKKTKRYVMHRNNYYDHQHRS
jgi:hypothetical protein